MSSNYIRLVLANVSLKIADIFTGPAALLVENSSAVKMVQILAD